MQASDNKLSLRDRAVRAGAWTLGGHVGSQFMRLGGNLIMTRLLVPEMFGIMALANVFYTGLALFSDLGLRTNIIQSKRGDDPIFLNTVWTVQVIRGGVIWLLAISLAATLDYMNSVQLWPSGSVYAEPLLPYVIAIITFNAVISGFNSTKLATADRNMLLGLVTRIELFSQATGLILMIAWALIDRSIWALVAGSLLASVVKLILSHIVMPGIQNKLHWDTQSFHEVFHFGKWIFVASILGFLAANGDRLILSSLVDSSTLGIYAIAFLIMKSIQQVFSKLINKVAFPALSEIARERPADLLTTYYKIRRPIDAIALFAAGFLFMTGQLLIAVLYDDRYLQAGQILEILSLSLFMDRYILAGKCFVALGKPKLLVPMIVVKLTVIFLFVPISFSLYGLEGSLWVIAGSKLPALPIIFYLKARHNFLSMMREYYAIIFLGVGVSVGWFVRWLVLMA